MHWQMSHSLGMHEMAPTFSSVLFACLKLYIRMCTFMELKIYVVVQASSCTRMLSLR